MAQQHARMARVLGGDGIGFAQHSQGAESDVLEMADGCGDDKEPGRHGRRVQDFGCSRNLHNLTRAIEVSG